MAFNIKSNFSDKSNQRVRDTILLKKFKSLLREQKSENGGSLFFICYNLFLISKFIKITRIFVE